MRLSKRLNTEIPVTPASEGDRRRLQRRSGKKRLKQEQKDSYWLGKFGAASTVRTIDPTEYQAEMEKRYP
jgi:hypothetical protein